VPISAPSNYSSSMRGYVRCADHTKYDSRNTRKGIISTQVALNGCASPSYSFAPFACIPSPGTLSLLSEIIGCNVNLSDSRINAHYTNRAQFQNLRTSFSTPSKVRRFRNQNPLFFLFNLLSKKEKMDAKDNGRDKRRKKMKEKENSMTA